MSRPCTYRCDKDMTATGSTHTHGEKTGSMAGASHLPFFEGSESFPRNPSLPSLPISHNMATLGCKEDWKSRGRDCPVWLVPIVNQVLRHPHKDQDFVQKEEESGCYTSNSQNRTSATSFAGLCCFALKCRTRPASDRLFHYWDFFFLRNMAHKAIVTESAFCDTEWNSPRCPVGGLQSLLFPADLLFVFSDEPLQTPSSRNDSVPSYCKNDEGDIFLAAESWKPDVCTSCVCMESVISCYSESCPSVSCERPVLRKGQCCPYCIGKTEKKTLSSLLGATKSVLTAMCLDQLLFLKSVFPVDMSHRCAVVTPGRGKMRKMCSHDKTLRTQCSLNVVMLQHRHVLFCCFAIAGFLISDLPFSPVIYRWSFVPRRNTMPCSRVH